MSYLLQRVFLSTRVKYFFEKDLMNIVLCILQYILHITLDSMILTIITLSDVFFSNEISASSETITVRNWGVLGF